MTQIHLNMHIRRMHSKERRFVCEQCNKSFVEYCEIAKHKRSVHSNVRDFKCTYCDRAFKTLNVLKGHMATHLQIRRFVCDLCERRFLSSSDLSKHRARHHAEEELVSTIPIFNASVDSIN